MHHHVASITGSNNKESQHKDTKVLDGNPKGRKPPNVLMFGL